ncbi:hypothetical protein PVAND_009127 [Polypedilum vanderplanki]|uniref:Viral A-type inclusion protein n=1 Tax=Polypedilum vanderplanki TaxID=319348 RepID=A0A9J6CC53_POLVA|nr:hypothetical protein PVAND_009127 [Polypedilum vanderplanki]
MEKFSLLKIVIILIFMMKIIQGQNNFNDDDYDNRKECENIFVCRLSSEIFSFLTKVLQIEEKISENFISVFFNSFVNEKSEIAENLMRTLNEYKMMIPYITNYMNELMKIDNKQMKDFINNMNINLQLKSEIEKNFKQLQISYEKFTKEEIKNADVFKREIMKNIKDIQEFLQNFIGTNYENNGVYTTIKNIIDEYSQIFTKINKEKNSKIDKKIKNENIVLMKKSQEIFKSFTSLDLEKINFKMQQFMFEIHSFYNKLMKNDMNEDSTLKMQMIEANKFFNVIQHLLNMLSTQEYKDFEFIGIKIKNCIDKFLHFFEAIKQETKNELNTTELYYNLKEKESNTEDSNIESLIYLQEKFEGKTNNFELELQKVSNEIELFCEFLKQESKLVQNNHLENYDQTNIEIENFIEEIKECIRMLEMYNYNDNLTIYFIQQILNNTEKFYDRTIECEISKELMPQNEILQFLNKIEELNEVLSLVEKQEKPDFVVNYDYFIINDEDSENEKIYNEEFFEKKSNETSFMSDQIETTTEYINEDLTTKYHSTENIYSLYLSKLDSLIKNFDENAYTYADMENLQRQISELIILKAKISDTNMQMEVDKLVEQAERLLERTRENFLKNYTRLQQLMNIVKEKMSEEKLGDIKVLDKNIEKEINELLPRMEVNYQIAAKSLLNEYKEFRKIMQKRNAAMIRLEKIAFELKEGNFTGKNKQIKSDIIEIAEIFNNTKYEKIVEVIFKKINLILKANKILNIADIILEASENEFQLNLEQIYSVKEKILVILETTKNIITKQRAYEIYQKLEARLKKYENEILEKLQNVSINLSPIESLDLEELKTLSVNLKSISKSIINKQIKMKVEKLLIKIKSIQQRFYEILDDLEFFNTALYIPSVKNDIQLLKSLLLVLTDLARFRDSSVISKVKELDSIIKKIIYDFEVKNELQEINRELINIEQAQTGSDVNDNIMKLQNLEIKIEEIEADEETENDVQEVLENIQQMRQDLPFKTTQLTKEKSGKILEVIVYEIISIIKHTISQIVDLDVQLTQLDQSNKSQFDVKMLNNETNRIALDMEKIYDQLTNMNLPSLSKEETELVSKNNGNIKSIIEQLISFNYLYNNSEMNGLYKSVLDNSKNFRNILNILENISKTTNENEL